jgi:hypothetical protein
MKMTIKIDPPEILGDRGLQFAVMRATALGINRGAVAGRALLAQGVREEFTAKSSAIKSRVTIKKANMRWLRAEIIINGKPLLLSVFKTTGDGKKRIVKIQVKKGTGMKPLKHAFRARMNGIDAIWQRKGKSRFPVKGLRGPSVPGMIRATIFKKLETRMNERARAEVAQAIQYAVGKGRVHYGE